MFIKIRYTILHITVSTLLLLYGIVVFAQQPTYINYTLTDGLPSMKVYNIMQDKQGYIWLATSMGLSRFNGYEFTNFTSADGLPGNAIIDFKQTDDGQIWLRASNGKTGYIYKGKIRTIQTDLFGEQPLPEINIDYGVKNDALQQALSWKQKQYFKQSVSCSFKEKDSPHIWVGTWGGGVFYASNYETDSIKVRPFLKNKTITTIFKDKEANMWFCTLDEGVFLLTNQNAITFNQSDGLPSPEIYSISQDKNRNIWLGGSKGTLSKITPNEIQNYEISSSENTYNRINDILVDEQEKVWIATDKGLKVQSSDSWIILGAVEPVKSIITTKDNAIWIGSYTKPIQLDIYDGIPKKALTITQINALCFSPDSTLWIGTANGLWKHKGNKTSYLGEQHQLLNKGITHIKCDKENRLWIGTEANGLIIKPIDNNVLQNITPENGLCSNMCLSIFIDEQNNGWIATNKGLNKVPYAYTKSKKNTRIKAYTQLDGLASNHVNDVLVDKDSVWVATLKGLTFFRQSEMRQQLNMPPIFIKKVQIWNRDTLLRPHFKLAHDDNNINIFYEGLSYKSNGQINYRYRMKGLDDEWRTTTQNNIAYPSLPPGEYYFQVVAIDKDDIMSKNVSQVRFNVFKPYWQTWWFRILMLALLLGLIALVGYFVIRSIKDRSELQRKMIESEQLALRTQMNPHFIFNALNSIQYYITENDKKSANLYLSTFSTLIRRVLDNSKKSRIVLEDEIEYLGLYLDIESLRFKGKFDYKIEVSPQVEMDELYVPPMLIQPYIENAIQHGLLRKEENDRQLLIKFDQKGAEVLICTVEDNGIGRAKAAALKAARIHKHKGIGTVNPKERLILLNRLHQQSISVNTIDLNDGRGNAKGTRIEINIPVFYE